MSVIIVSYNGVDLLRKCLRALMTSVGVRLDVVVVDCASVDGTSAMVKSLFPSVRLMRFERDPGFAAANNNAARESNSPFILLLNNDVIVRPDTIAALLKSIDGNSICTGAQYTWSGDFFDCGAAMNWCGRICASWIDRLFGKDDTGPFFDALACVLVPRELMLRFPLNELIGFYEDVEWGWRLNLSGVTVRSTPDAVFFHKIGGSTKGTPKQARAAARSLGITPLIVGSFSTLIILLPSFALYGAKLLGAYLITIGSRECTWAFVSGLWSVATDLGTVVTLRTASQRLRTKSDRAILRKIPGSLSYLRRCAALCPRHLEVPVVDV